MNAVLSLHHQGHLQPVKMGDIRPDVQILEYLRRGGGGVHPHHIRGTDLLKL